MMPTRSPYPAIRSSLAADPALRELVRQFVDEMPGRLAWIERQLNAGNWEALKRAAHQLKGAAGSYGFDELAPHALRLETLIVNESSPAEIVAAVDELVARGRAVTADAL